MKMWMRIFTLLLLIYANKESLYGQTLLLESRVDSMISAMTMAEKIAQLNGNTNFTTADLPRLNIPGFKMTDGAHGVSGGGSSFPSTIAMAATWDKKLIYDIGRAISTECWRLDINQLLAPAIDLTRDTRAGRTSESCGEDPYLNGQISLAATRGIQSMPVIATTKHFLTEARQFIRFISDQTYTPRWMMEHFGYNFRLCAQDGASLSFMSSYNLVNGFHASRNPYLLQTVLRQRWGFPFYVVSDWGGIYTGETQYAIKAGNDLCMGTPHYTADLPWLTSAGLVPEYVIDNAVRNILRVKLLSGIIGYIPPKPDRSIVTTEHAALARLCVRESVVLLKNEAVLPVIKDRTNCIAVIGPSAEIGNIGFTAANIVYSPYSVSVLQGLQQKYGASKVKYTKGCNINDGDTSKFAAARTLAAQCDVVIFTGGLDDTQEGEFVLAPGKTTDRSTTNLPATQQKLINELAKINPNIIVVLQSGGICNISDCIQNVKGFLYSFYSGMEAGNGIADVISGDYNPAGRLPITMPANDNQLPVWDDDFTNDFGHGYRWFDEKNITPAFPFGFGLSYTSFSYSHLQSPVSVQKGIPVHISVDITNTGRLEGDEVVQLYVSNKAANIWMPKKELKGFERIHLLPGETKTVTFTVNTDEMYYWDESKNTYAIFPGQYTFGIGGSSDNLPIQGTFEWQQSSNQPDLRITEIFTLPRFPRIGEKVTFYAMVKNEGTDSTLASALIDVPFYIDNRLVATANQLSLQLQPGQCKLITCTDTSWTADYIGTSQLSASVDAANRIAELVENNNVYQKPLEVFFNCDNLTNNNAAYQQPVRASSFQNSDLSAYNLVDGKLNTRWASNLSEPQNIVITLDSITNIGGMVLYWEAAYSKNYTIQVSSDSLSWTTVFVENNGAGNTETKLFSTSGKYVKLNLSGKVNWLWGFSLYEIKIINADVAECATIPVAHAGNDTTLSLPVTDFQLNGTRSYDPSGNSLTYLWTQISGPNQSVLSDNTTVQPSVSNLTNGEYVFSLAVNNGAYTVQDLVVINISSAIRFIPTGIIQIPKTPGDIRVFPNPAKDLLMIDTKLKCNSIITLTDMLGRVSFQTPVELTGSIYNLSLPAYLTSGMYLVSIRTEKGILTTSVVINK